MDIELRRLERLAAGNDPDALQRYKMALRRSGEWLALITRELMNDNPTEALIDLAKVRPGLRGDIARQAGIDALQQTGIWHGLCLLSEEDYAFHLNAEANGFWGKRSDYPDHWTIGNITDSG